MAGSTSLPATTAPTVASADAMNPLRLGVQKDTVTLLFRPLVMASE